MLAEAGVGCGEICGFFLGIGQNRRSPPKSGVALRYERGTDGNARIIVAPETQA
jgi:hypothetical protein